LRPIAALRTKRNGRAGASTDAGAAVGGPGRSDNPGAAEGTSPAAVGGPGRSDNLGAADGTSPGAAAGTAPLTAGVASRRRESAGFWRGFTRPVRYATLLAGALPILAFPALDLEFIAWFGLVPGLLLIRAAPTRREAVARGWWFGVGYLLADLYWLTPNLGPGLLLVVIVLGLPWAGIGYATWRLLRSPGSGEYPTWRLLQPPGPSLRQSLAAMLVLPSCWVVIDWIRSWQGIGGPWGVLGTSQWQHPVVLSLAAVGGVWLISFVLVAANTGIVIALTSLDRVGRLAGAACTVLAVAAAPVAFALTSAAYAVPATAHLRLALVQPGPASGGPNRLLGEEIRLSRGLRGADLIVWGESSVGYDLNTYHATLAKLQRLSAATGAELLVSEDAHSPSGAHIKQAVLVGPNGIDGSYVKTRLVPFGEYIPFRSVLGWLASISRAAAENMAPGSGARVLHAVVPGGRGLPFGVLICFESSFPDMSRVDAEHGARVIIYQTSDSTFQGSWAPEQHASLAAVRAAETGRPAAQAALTGDTAAFDARGSQLAWAGTTDRKAVTVTLALPRTAVTTPFDRYGDYIPWLAIAIVVIAVFCDVAAARRAGRNPGSGPPARDLAS
jgi:apolipoprotein N-acyltransferase